MDMDMDMDMDMVDMVCVRESGECESQSRPTIRPGSARASLAKASVTTHAPPKASAEVVSRSLTCNPQLAQLKLITYKFQVTSYKL